MNLLNRFMQNIANICGVSFESIHQDGNKIFVGSHELPFLGVFFEEGSPETKLTDYFNTYEEDPKITGKILTAKQGNSVFNVRGLNADNKYIDAGIYEITEINSGKTVVFTGSFNNVCENLDLTCFPEILLAIAVLEKTRCADSVSWMNILECLGPFVIFQNDPPLLSLAECGLSFRRQNTFSFTWSNSLPTVVQTRKPGIPSEAETAYLAALHDSVTADIAFLRLYRVLEILFAGTYKDEIAKADLCKVISLIQNFQSMSELDTLKKLVEKSTSSFTHFTNTDFNNLFAGHQPGGNYTKITNWLSNTSNTIPPDEIRALIIYYVRCSLVHSKLTGKEPFLIGPFSFNQEEALNHLVEDTRELIKGLLY